MADRKSIIADAAFGGGMLVVASVVLALAWRLPPSPFDPLGPGAFPLAVAGLLAGLALILLGRLALGFSTGQSATSIIQGFGTEEDHRRRPWLAVGLYLWTIIYVLALADGRIGFLLATIVYIGVLGYGLSKRTRIDGVTAVIVAITGGIGIWLLFTKVFLVLWP